MTRVVFRDLAGPDGDLDEDQLRWLARLAPMLNTPSPISLQTLAARREDPEPVLVPQLDGSWRAGRYIGELQRDGRVLEITPRLGIPTIAAWIGAIFNVRITSRAASQRGTSALIAQLMAATWQTALVSAARDTLPGLRRPQYLIGPYASGPLDVAATAKLRIARQPYLASTRRPRQLDNPVTRSIVLAERALSRRLHGTTWQTPRSREILTTMRGAAGPRPTLPSARELAAVRYTPITLPYKRVAQLSHQIASGRGLRASATAETDDALLLDVAELWELFLLHCARRAFGNANVTHGTALNETRALLHSASDPARTMGRLYPDIIVGPPHQPNLIIDAKYKRLTDGPYGGVAREDLYQLHAYTTAFAENRPARGALAYPQFDQSSAPAAQANGPWEVTGSGTQLQFTRLPVTEPECIAALQSLAAPYPSAASAAASQ